MRQYFILMRPLWKEMLGSFEQGFGLSKKKGKKRKPRSKIASILLFGFLFLMLGFYSVIYGVGITQFLILAGNPDGFIQMVALGAPLLILLFGILQAIPTLYHETSLESLLVLPLKPSVIIGGKITQAYFPAAVFPIAFFFPALIAHGIVAGRPWAFYVQSIPFMFFVTFMPFAVVVILLLFIMRYTKFARDKDRFQMVTSIFTVLLAVGFSLFINMQNVGTQIPGSQMFGPDGRSTFMSGALPYIPSSYFGAGMLLYADSGYSLLNGLLALLVNAFALGVLLLLARRLYIPGVLGMQAGGKPTKQLTREAMHRALRPRKAYRAIVQKEWKILLRTPAFFTQTILGAVLMPALMIGVMIMTLSRMDSSGDLEFDLIGMLQIWNQSGAWKNSLWLIVMIASAAAAFFSGSNMMSASAISRQGKLFYYSKLIPVPARVQVFAWLTPGLMSTTLIWLFLTAGITIFLKGSFLFGLIVFVTAWLNAYLVQIVSFFTDMFFPNLDWTNEIQPVKNTKATMVSGLGMFVYAGTIVGVGFLFRKIWGGHDLLTALSLFIFSLVIVILATLLVLKRSDRLFSAIDI